jgi:pimeloyl-ACP methyl ester carboxylesterase
VPSRDRTRIGIGAHGHATQAVRSLTSEPSVRGRRRLGSAVRAIDASAHAAAQGAGLAFALGAGAQWVVDRVSTRMQVAVLPESFGAALLARSLCRPFGRRGRRSVTEVVADARFFLGSDWPADRIAAQIEAARQTSLGAADEWVAAYDWSPASATDARRGLALLSHGWSGYAFNFVPLVERLRTAGFRVVAIDHLGHGASSGSRSSFPKFVRGLAAAARVFGQPEVLVGHSLGGGAAAYAAATNQVRARKVVLLAPYFYTAAMAGRFAAPLGLSARQIENMEREIERHEGASLDSFAPSAIGAQLGRPTLVLHDPRDGIAPFASSADLAAASSSVMLHALDGVGHVRVLAAKQALELCVRFAKPSRASAPSR